MKKVIGTLVGFLSVCLIVCFVIGFLVESPVSSFGYKVLNAFDYFLGVLPYLLIMGYIIGFSTYYANNYSGSALRFSESMTKRYKGILIVALVCTFALSLSTEVFQIGVKTKKNNMENRPKLIQEYIKVGNILYENKLYQRAADYANAALELDKTSREADTLKTKATVAYNERFVEGLRDRLNESYAFDTVDRVNIDSESISEVYRYYIMALECEENQDWFKAHYYANLGLNLATSKDPNLVKLKEISTDSWNNIEKLQKLDNREEQLWYEQKYQGYKALVSKDYLTSYYIFQNLYNSSKTMQMDPEVNFYLEVAEKKIEEKCFFIDETYELKSFETANDVFFSYPYKDGSMDIVYCKGISIVKTTGNAIQYLRGLTIQSIDENGNFYRSMDVPYAKVLPVSVKTLNPVSKTYLGIDDKTEFVPYVMLKSVSREEGPSSLPTYVYKDGRITNSPEYMILPVPYADFLLLEDASVHPDNIPLVQLLKLVPIADKYGFSREAYGSALMDRLLYPIVVLIMFVLLGSFAWSTRVNANQYFQIHWLLCFPVFFLVSVCYYRSILFVFRIVNFVFYSLSSNYIGVLSAVIFYIILFVAASITFCSKHTYN